jgi:hypothetical protein
MTTAERYDAFVAMLDAPDLPDLPPRRRHYTQVRDVAKCERSRIAFARAYLLHRMADAGRLEDAIVSVRRLGPAKRRAA